MYVTDNLAFHKSLNIIGDWYYTILSFLSFYNYTAVITHFLQSALVTKILFATCIYFQNINLSIKYACSISAIT